MEQFHRYVKRAGGPSTGVALQVRSIEIDGATAGQVLVGVTNGGRVEFVPGAAPGGSSPLTTEGDLYIFASGVDARLAVGSTPQYLGVTSGLPAWKSFPWSTHTSTGTSTADATQTTCGSYTVPNNSGAFIELTVHANRVDRTAGAGWKVRAHVINDVGTVTISGNDVVVDGPIGSAITWAVTLDVSGTAVRLRVTGEAAVDIDWTARWIVN